MIPFQETRRLFGPVNRLDHKTNVRHRAILRKALELFSQQELLVVFTEPIRLRVVMGSALTSNQLGKITTHYQHNGRLVARETDTPELEARVALRAYRDAYDLYFKSRGNDYTIRNTQALLVLQAAEQTWHDWIVPYLAARGRPTRPDWALQPLPGLQRVQGLPPPPPARPRPTPVPAPQADTSPIQTPQRRLAQASLPTPPRTPARAAITRPAGASAAHTAVGSCLRPIEFVDSDEEGGRRQPEKRKFLGIVDISDSKEEGDAHPRKKMRLLGAIDLTN
ncbi:hypothetical protein B0H17DRAFT_1217611 [Mycena rosella]|uniref:Uncharacterized protein n=1 Tax=Mycena rosella TaxID=1033263 RepID=A0AAD7BVI7_MYCRO|nr:hypothetical protein B0H17DRAFT_1217611 [Mycena rosella]